MALLGRIFLCIFVCGLLLYRFVDAQNDLILLRLEIPRLEKDLKKIDEDNSRLRYQLDRFESPIQLMKFSRHPDFSHLRYPYSKDVLILPKPEPLDLSGVGHG